MKKGLWTSRILSLAIAGYGLSQYQDPNILRACFVYALLLLSIWFPGKLSDLTVGASLRSHTALSPTIVIAALGWVLLLGVVITQVMIWDWFESLS